MVNLNPVQFLQTNRRKTGENRPRIMPEMSPADWLLEGFALLTLLGFLGFILYSYPNLPDSVPSHFNGAGKPDDWSSKNSIWFLLAVGVFVYALLTIVSRFPHSFNFPGRITPENAMRQYTLAIRLLRVLKIVIVLLFFFISLSVVQVATGQSTGLGLWFLPVFLSAVFGPLIVYFIVAARK